MTDYVRLVKLNLDRYESDVIYHLHTMVIADKAKTTTFLADKAKPTPVIVGEAIPATVITIDGINNS